MADVQLSGYEGPRGFRPVQVYDRSQQLQQVAQQEKEYRDRSFADYKNKIQQFGQDIAEQASDNLEALSGFSNTLSQFLIDYQEKENDKQYKLGLAEVMNGNVQLPQSAFDKHHTEVESLRVAAESDGEVANEITGAGNFEFGTDFRQTSKAVRGWRAYGRAVGTAKKAALGSQGFLQEFWTRTDPIVRVADGYKSPSEIAVNGNKAEVAAALSLAQNEYFQVNKLYNLNPIVLAENFAPTWQAVRAQSVANTMASIQAKNQETAVFDAQAQVNIEVSGIDYSQPDAAAKLTEAYQQQVSNLVTLGGQSQGRANSIVLSQAIESILLMDDERATAALDALEKVVKVPSMGDKGTLGALHGNQIAQARRDVAEKNLQRRRQEQAIKAEKVDDLYSQLTLLRTEFTGSPAELDRRTKAIKAQIRAIGGVRANQILANDHQESYLPKDYVLYNRSVRAVDEGGMTLDEIDKLDLREDLKQDLRQKASDRARSSFEKDYGTLVTKAAGATLRLNASKEKPYTFDAPDGRPNEDPVVFEMYRDDVEEQLYDYMLQNPDATKQQIQAEANRIAKDVYGQYYQNGRAKSLKTPAGYTTTTSLEDGQKINDLRQVSDDQLATANWRGVWSSFNNTLVLSEQALDKEIELLESQQAPGQRVATYLGGNLNHRRRFLNSQLRHYGRPPLDNTSPAAQTEARVRAMSPYAARNYYLAQDPIGSARAAEDLAIAKAEADRQRGNNQPKVGRSGQQIVSDDELFQLAINAGATEQEAVILTAIAIAESGADPGIDTVQSGTDPDRRYEFSMGLWQINMLDGSSMRRNRIAQLRSQGYQVDDNASQLYDPQTNAQAAVNVLRSQGFNAWSVFDSGNGKYRTYRKAAELARARWRMRQQSQQ